MLIFEDVMKALFLLLALICSVQGFSGENDATPTDSGSNDQTASSNDAGPTIAETIAQITNDPGAAFGGGR